MANLLLGIWRLSFNIYEPCETGIIGSPILRPGGVYSKRLLIKKTIFRSTATVFDGGVLFLWLYVREGVKNWRNPGANLGRVNGSGNL